MDEELEQFCHNCKKNVGAANFASHSAFCQRNITICEVCNEPIPKNSMKEHEEEYHISVICDMCETSIKKWRLAKHQEEICPKRRVICEFCEADFPIDKAEEHNEFCGSRTEKCPICLKFIMFRHKKKHSEFHMHQENFCRGNGAGEMHQNTMNEIISKTSEKGLKSNKISVSSKKNDSVVTDDFEFGSLIGASAPAPEKTKSKEISDKYTKCHLCRDYILWSEYDQHMTNCAPENGFRKCPYCDEYVPPKLHDYKTCEMKKKLKTQINKSESTAKYRSPSNFEKSESKAECRSLSNYGKSESKTEYRSVSYDCSGDHTEDELKLCPYCKQLWPQDTIYEHIKSCPEDYYECDLCLEMVLVKNRDTHLSTQCKMVLKERILSDFYECPLCGETLPETDKASHESFSCRTLLHNNAGPLYTLPDEKTPRNYVPETYENPTETCMNCKKKIPLYQVFNHKQSCYKSMTKQCPYCEKELHRDEPEEKHLRICEVYKQIVNLNDDDERSFGHKGAKPKHPKISEFVIPKAGKCAYCKTTLNKDILLYHEKECLYKEIRCPDCYSTMLLKDSDKHHCKSPKRKDKGSGGRRTQKAEKSESKNSWLTFPSLFGGNKSSVKPTLDEHQNDRNEFYETHMMTRYHVPEVKKDEDLYFGQQSMMDEPKIPCEFCDKLFPASEVVLHTTGCNPTEVSLPKPVSAVRQKGNETSSKQLKRFYDSTITSEPFFPAGRGTPIPSAKYESIHKRLEQSMPGQYLNCNTGEASKTQMLHSDFQSISRKNQSSSAVMSVWNNDSSDVEMEEADTKLNSETTIQNLQENLKGHSRKLSHESGKCSNDSDEEISNMMNFIEGNTTEPANLKEENDSHTLDKHTMSETPADEDSSPSKCCTEMSCIERDFLRQRVDNATNISSFEAIPKEYVPNIKSDHHRMSDFLIEKEKNRDSLSEETSKAYSSKLVSEYTVSNTDRNQKEERSWKNAHYVSYDDENSVPDRVTKESTINQNFVYNKMKDSDDDNAELDHFSKTDKYQYKKNIHRTDSDSSQPETHDDEKEKQPAHDITETEFILDQSKKSDLSNFRFCGNKMKTSTNESGKLQNSKNEEYDVYYKTNSLGYVIVSEDEESKIRRPRKNEADVSQNNILRLKYEYQDDNTAGTTQDKRDENRTENISSYMPEKAIEVIRSKYEYQDDNVIETSQEERTKSRTQYVESPLYEKSVEMLRQKYRHEYVDDILARQKKEFESKTEDFSPPMSGSSQEMLRQKYRHEYVDDIRARQKKEFESKMQDLSPPISETSQEMLRQKYQHEYIDDILASQKKEFERKTQDFSPPMSETSKKMLHSKYMYQDDNAIEMCQKEVAKIKIQDVSSSIHEKPFEILRSKYKYQDDEEKDVGQHERFKSKTRDVSSAKMEISKEMSRSKYKYQDDEEEDVGQHETFKSKTRDVSSVKPEISKEMSRSKYRYQDDDEEDIGQHERFKNKTRDVSSVKPEISKEMSRSKYKYQDDEEDIGQHERFKNKTRDVSSVKCEISKEDDDSQARQKGKAGSGIEGVSASNLEKSKEKSKYFTVCPMCRETIRWIDYNTHIPACASSSGRCARCGLEVPGSDLKEHILVKCSKILGKVESAKERNQQILRTSAHSYERIVQSLTSNENVGEKKSHYETRDQRQQFQNARMKTSASSDKVDCTESYKSSDASRTKQAFKIEPAESYRNQPEANNRKVVGISENSRESHLKKTGESPKSFPSNEEDLKKWYKWRSKTSDV